MSGFFGSWGRLITLYNRWILLIFLSIYIAIGQNIRNVQNFPKHESESYVWAPVGNPTFLNEQKMRRIFDKTKRDQFWKDYNSELDPGI